jgi:dienelactone hydrolase
MLVEYRGYGMSEGVASEKGFYKDAEAAVSHLFSRSDIDNSKIIVFGQSIGGAVVIDLVRSIVVFIKEASMMSIHFFYHKFECNRR